MREVGPGELAYRQAGKRLRKWVLGISRYRDNQCRKSTQLRGAGKNKLRWYRDESRPYYMSTCSCTKGDFLLVHSKKRTDHSVLVATKRGTHVKTRSFSRRWLGFWLDSTT